LLPLGTEVMDSNGYIYKYVHLAAASANAGSAGRWVWYNATANEVSDDINGSGVQINRPAGMCIGTITKDYYGFIMTDGYYAAALKLISTGLDIAANDFLIAGDDSQDGTVKAMTAGSAATYYAQMGTCKTDVTGLATTMAAYVRCR